LENLQKQVDNVEIKRDDRLDVLVGVQLVDQQRGIEENL